MTVITRQPIASYDDCQRTESEEWITVSITAPDVVAGKDYDPWTPLHYIYDSGVRFQNVTIPQGATITSAYLKLKCDISLAVNTVNTRFKGENSDNAIQFTTVLSAYDNRPRTTAYVDWSALPAWVLNATYTSPDLKAIIQEIINRAGWVSGNALVLFWHDNGSSNNKIACERQAYSYNNSPANSPILEIDYVETGVAPTSRGDGLSWIVSLLNKSKKPLRGLPLKGIIRGLKT